MPAPHEFLTKRRIAGVDLLNRRRRNAAHERCLHSDGGVLVRLIEQSFQPRSTAAPEQADDPLVPVRQVLGELDKTTPHREHRLARIPDTVDGNARLELQIFDGQIESL